VRRALRAALFFRDPDSLHVAHLERLAVAYEAVDITGDPELEARYREWLPVVEIDGERAFVYYVDEAALLRKLGRHS
jgi:hypothetical protein